MNGLIKIEDIRGKYVFWDIDGTLAPYRFNDQIYIDNNKLLSDEFNDDCFFYREPSKHMINVLKECQSKKNIIISCAKSQREINNKRIWLNMWFFEIDDMYLIPETQNKYEIIINYCSTHNINIEDTIFVDDNIMNLIEAEKHGIKSYHISSFLDWNFQKKPEFLIEYKIDKETLKIKLIDTLCKHVFDTDGIYDKEKKANKFLETSKSINYNLCLLNSYVGQIKDFKYEIDKILRLEKDRKEHPVTLIKVKSSDNIYYWCDDFYSSIINFRQKGLCVHLKDIPFCIIDLTESIPKLFIKCDSFDYSDKNINYIIKDAKSKQYWMNNKEILDINYTMKNFLNDNFMFYAHEND